MTNTKDIQTPPNVLPDLKGAPKAFTLQPKTLGEAMEYAKLLSNSDLVPKDYKGKPENVLIAVQMGAELGLPPTQAIQNIAVINGRPALWGDAVLALAKASPLCEHVIEEFDAKQATCRVKRRGEAEVVRTFTMDDAKKAGLANKQGPWTQYPARMLQMRARSWAIRDVFPDLLKGISMLEEVRDIESGGQEKDITPLQDKLNKRLGGSIEGAATAAEEVDEDAVLALIADAATMEELSAAGNQAGQLSEAGAAKARLIYVDRRKELRAAETAAGTRPDEKVYIDPETGEEVPAHI